MADLNSEPDLQQALRENVIAPTLFADLATLRAKHSSFMKGGELASVTTITLTGDRTFIWVPAATLTDDNVSVLKPDDLATTDPGRWLLIGQRQLTCSGTYDPANLADGAGATTTLACNGAALGDLVIPSFSLDLQGILLTAYVSAANVVSFRFQNETGGAIDLASGTLRALVMKQ